MKHGDGNRHRARDRAWNELGKPTLPPAWARIGTRLRQGEALGVREPASRIPVGSRAGCPIRLKPMERVMGIEPTLAAWEAAVLPLNYTRAVRSEILNRLAPTHKIGAATSKLSFF